MPGASRGRPPTSRPSSSGSGAQRRSCGRSAIAFRKPPPLAHARAHHDEHVPVPRRPGRPACRSAALPRAGRVALGLLRLADPISRGAGARRPGADGTDPPDLCAQPPDLRQSPGAGNPARARRDGRAPAGGAADAPGRSARRRSSSARPTTRTPTMRASTRPRGSGRRSISPRRATTTRRGLRHVPSAPIAPAGICWSAFSRR
jgi:hypothetical protein